MVEEPGHHDEQRTRPPTDGRPLSSEVSAERTIEVLGALARLAAITSEHGADAQETWNAANAAISVIENADLPLYLTMLGNAFFDNSNLLALTPEQAAGAQALPDDGFQIACFPVKIRAASAGWTRAVAIIDE